MKKTLAILLAVALIATVAIGGTLAYLTDRDAEVNIFTVGNVEIEVEENFNQGEELMPGVSVTKEVSIKNTGDNDAWIWYSYAVPVLPGSMGDLIEVTHESVGSDWVELRTPYTMTIEGETYNVYTVGWNAIVAPDASTGMGMSKVTLNRWIDFNVNDGNWYHVYGGNTTQIMDVDNARVYVTGYAIQAAGIDTLSDAFALFNEQWGNPNMDPAVPMNPAPVDYELNLTDAADPNMATIQNIEADGCAITVDAASGTNYIEIGDVVVVAEEMLIDSGKALGVYMYDSEINVGSGIRFVTPNHTVIIADCTITLDDGEYLVTGVSTGQVIIGENVVVNGTLLTASNYTNYLKDCGSPAFFPGLYAADIAAEADNVR
jgi:predicted ribosomally synthesized peptide with SipW-like signal peptide